MGLEGLKWLRKLCTSSSVRGFWTLVILASMVVPGASAVEVLDATVDLTFDLSEARPPEPLQDEENPHVVGCRAETCTGGQAVGGCPTGTMVVDTVRSHIGYDESATATGCAGAFFKFSIPEGADLATVRFGANRSVTFQDLPPLGQPQPERNAVQNLVWLHGEDLLEEDAIFSADAPSSPTPKGVESSVGLGAWDEVAVVFWFSDQGTLAVPQTVPNVASGYAFNGTAEGIRIQFANATGSAVVVERNDPEQFGDELSRYGAQVSVTAPVALSHRFDLALKIQASSLDWGTVTDLQLEDLVLWSADGQALGVPVSVTRTGSNTFALSFAPPQGAPGPFTLDLVVQETVVPHPPPSVSPPAKALWMFFVAVTMSVVATVVAGTANRLFSRDAKGIYERTARALWIVFGLLVGLSVVVYLMGLSLQGLTALIIIPLSTFAVFFYVILVALVVFLILEGVFAATFMRRAMRQDLAQREEQAQELARSNEELERFAYVASHDLQEPLRKVAASTTMLKNRYGDQLDPSADKWIDYAVDGSKRMQDLIQSLLSFSRVGRNQMQWKTVDTEEMVVHVIEDLDGRIQDVKAKVTHGDLPKVHGDDVYLRQVFQNLIGNGIKYVPADRAPVVHVEAKKEAGFWHFIVRDNGIGIPEEKRGTVFDVFTRLHGRGEYDGTGIGLAIVKKVVEMHGGRVWIEGSEGIGSEFHFTLPS